MTAIQLRNALERAYAAGGRRRLQALALARQFQAASHRRAVAPPTPATQYTPYQKPAPPLAALANTVLDQLPVNDVLDAVLPSSLAAVETVASVALPLATLGIMGYALLGGDSSGAQTWRASMQAQYGFRPDDVSLTNPYTGGLEHFGNYQGVAPTDMFLARGRGGRLL